MGIWPFWMDGLKPFEWEIGEKSDGKEGREREQEIHLRVLTEIAPLSFIHSFKVDI
jgi:hypothetical protein